MAALLKTFLDDHQYFDLNFDDFALHLKTNPDYPSLKAISDTLDYFMCLGLFLIATWNVLKR
jgi:hypothetical protein